MHSHSRQHVFRALARTLTGLAALPFFLHGQALAEGQTSPLPNPVMDQSIAKNPANQSAIFAGGCFWGVQAVFQHVKGVVSATSGYAGGTKGTAKYPLVSSGTTGHAEAVKVVYDPARVSYGQLLKVFFSVAHNPTQLNRQGPDAGTQYRSEIFVATSEQKKIAEAYIGQLVAARVYPEKIVTRVSSPTEFYPAEAYHQNYATLHPDEPYIAINDLPKLDHLKIQFPELYKQAE
ncbi:MAG: peptide-methionine (S)-S-oxide reductase MsrA [Betaproteobacteria bacterium]|nr:peptide-methionine (S)-S-oxide reductase MsrA [Betaproteobacteria bacterium]